MATPEELRAALAAARDELKAAIAAAAGNWEAQPPEGEGEDAWSPRQVAEHVIAAEAYFTTAICEACGYPGVDRVAANYPAADDALAGHAAVIEMCDKKLRHVTEKDLEMKHERWGTVAGLLALSAHHLREHAAQLRRAAGVA
ncbi:MAG: hypothetical protein Kow0010_16450 [Dehalococcoidia bacterium]